MNEFERISKTFSDQRDTINMLIERVERLEKTAYLEGPPREIAVMTLLQAMCQCTANREDLDLAIERLAAQMQAQPGFVLHGNSGNFHKMKEHLRLLAGISPPAD